MMKIQQAKSSPQNITAPTNLFRVKSETKLVSAPKKVQALSVLNKSKFIVYLVADANNKDQKYAMKVFPHQNGDLNPCYLKEERFSNLSHPYVISVVDKVPEKLSYIKDEKVMVSYILMELAPFGDFADLIMSEKLPKNEKLVRTYFYQMMEGLEYLHNNGIAHLDIKPENILLGSDYNLRVSDFDFSIKIEKGKRVGKAGTRNYRAPEIKDQTCTDPVAADIFSAGVFLFILKANIFPYNEDSTSVNLFNILLDEPSKFWEIHPQSKSHPKDFDDDFRSLFNAMTTRDPSERITIDGIKESKWYNGPIYSNEELATVMSRVAKSKI